MPKLVVLLVVIAIPAVTASSANASPANPLSASVVVSSGGPGHAPDEPLASLRSFKSSFQLFKKSRQLAVAANACKQHAWYQNYKFKNIYGVVLFSYHEQVYYCNDGTNVTYFYRYRWASVSSIIPVLHYSPWQFDGNVPSGNDCSNEHCFVRGMKSSSRTAVTEGKFETCLIPIINIGCNYDYPKITITVYGDGSRPDSGWSD